MISLQSYSQYRFQNLRFNEDYSYLKNDTIRNSYTRFKFVPLDRHASAYLSQGGEVRYQLQHYVNEDWGAVPDDAYTAFYLRFLYHADVHLSKRFRLFTQVNSSFAIGRPTPNRSIDENQLDVQQVFLDMVPLRDVTLRLGRQELLYGSQRLISVREGPNNRQSFDAARIIWKRRSLKVDAYYSHPVRVKTGIMDDAFNTREKLWSGYAVLNDAPWLNNIDLYYIGYYNQQKGYNAGVGEELRHSIGTRIWRKSASWNYDVEALYQFGSWRDQVIHAYTASVDASYTFHHQKMQPAVGLKTELISGDRNVNDEEMNTFNPLFPRGAYFGLAALIGPVNLIDVHPSVSIKPVRNLELSADYDVFWRYSTEDGIYGPNVVLSFGSNSAERFIGHQLGMSAEYQPNAFIKLTPEIMWFFPGPYLKDVSPGKRVFFGAFTAQIKF